MPSVKEGELLFLYLLLLGVRGEARRCKAEAAEAMLSVWRAERGRGSGLETRPR